ncbi:unnamed protein product, partial [Durusdinium trenchii]
EVQYWRSCGQALLRRAGTLKESVSQHQESRHTDLQVEMKAMDAQAVELRSRVKEVERMVANGRAQEVEMMTKTQGLLHSLSQAEQSLAASQAKVASLQAELQQAEARKPRASEVRAHQAWRMLKKALVRRKLNIGGERCKRKLRRLIGSAMSKNV